ncbi:MAG: hypothetical protein KBD64_03230 [Gammaproteobacteria bacterium]|nr:hypothetical protein [Gammaproteobacteria bacterium]
MKLTFPGKYSITITRDWLGEKFPGRETIDYTDLTVLLDATTDGLEREEIRNLLIESLTHHQKEVQDELNPLKQTNDEARSVISLTRKQARITELEQALSWSIAESTRFTPTSTTPMWEGFYAELGGGATSFEPVPTSCFTLGGSFTSYEP